MCGSEISDYLGNQRLTSNQQDFVTEKSFSVPNGKWFLSDFFKYCNIKDLSENNNNPLFKNDLSYTTRI